MTLREFFTEVPRLAVAFSGGSDSAYLLYAALENCACARAYYVKTSFQPEFEIDDARRFASALGAPLFVLEADILGFPGVRENGPDRCYLCKRTIMGMIKEAAAKDGFTAVADGTNASDPEDGRPGMRALRELGIRSPLKECGLTKAEVRRLSEKAGLFTWDKPAYACLATRIPCGTPIELLTLEKIEKSEDALRRLGFSDLRVRLFHGVARIQLPAAQAAAAAEKREAVLAALRPYFDTILLDMEAR